MKIEIKDRFRPFTHIPGSTFLLPGTPLAFKFFPSLIKVYDLIKVEHIKDVPLNIRAPMEDFTVFQDLEKRKLSLSGTTLDGFLRLVIFHKEGEVFFHVEKGNLTLTETFPWPAFQPQLLERLSLGNNKAQNCSLIQAREKMEEIFPLWFYLGQQIPTTPYTEEGNAHLLSLCKNLIAERKVTEIIPAFKNLYRTAFSATLIPHLNDFTHQGFDLPLLSENSSPLVLLTEGYKAIRSLFFQQKENHYFILPALPVELHCGRLHLNTEHGTLYQEWTKKTLRRLIFVSKTEATLTFHFQKEIKKQRLNKEKVLTNPTIINTIPNQIYYLDCFER